MHAFADDSQAGIPGFTDVFEAAHLPDTVVGEGPDNFYYNTNSASSQLSLAVALVQNRREEVGDIIDARTMYPTARRVVEALREARALSGMRVLDIGCGIRPTFALAAKALGAVVHTVDMQSLPEDVSKMLDSHTVTDLRLPDTAATLQVATGGDFDLVSQNIIGPVPEMPTQTVIDAYHLDGLAEFLLRQTDVHRSVLGEAGFYHDVQDMLVQQAVARPK